MNTVIPDKTSSAITIVGIGQYKGQRN